MTKEKRRDYGSGAVYQRKSDMRWIGAVLMPLNADGKRPRRVVSAKSEAQCKKKVRELIEQLGEEGVALGATATTVTVEQWAKPWLAMNKKRVRPKTHSNDATSVNRWIVPLLGKKRLSRLTPADIRSVEAAITAPQLDGTTRSTTTALRTHNVMMKMFRDAVIEGHPVPDRVFKMGAPLKGVSDRDAIPLDDALSILQDAAKPGGARWVAALLQGMRQGECLGLTWDCVDLVNGTIDVSWQLQAIPFEHGCGPVVAGKRPCGTRYGGDCNHRTHRIPDGYEYRVIDARYCLVRPKTAKGHRIIPMVPWMQTALAAWRQIAPASEHNLVWPQPDGRPVREVNDRRDWHDLQAAANVRHPSDRPYHLHEARHTTATLLLQAGVDPEVIKAILGHSSIVTSRGYMHVSQNLARKALEDVAVRLNLSAATNVPQIEAAAAAVS